MRQEHSLAGLRPVEVPENDELPIEQETKAESSVLGRALQTRGPPLTRNEEVELAKAIEEANRAILEAVVRSPVALGELVAIVEDVSTGTLDVAELTPTATDDEREKECMVAAIRDAVQRVQVSAHSGLRSHDRKAAEAHYVDTMLHYGLTHRAVVELLARLEAVRSEQRNRRAIDSTIRAIRNNQRASERAKATLVEANIGMVVWMANKRTHPGGLSLRDLVQEGSMGLMRAVDKFDYRRGVRFGTYASWWIRHALNRALSDQSRTIRIPVHLLETRYKVARVAQGLSQERGHEPTEAELSYRSGVAPEKIRMLSSIPMEPVSMDKPVGPDGDARIGDFVTNREAESALDVVSTKHAQDRIRHLLGTLSSREQEVLRLRFGIGSPDCLTFEQIGRLFSLSRERIRQIEVEALSKLRGLAAAEDLDSHLAG